MTLLSRISGLVRDIVFANLLGDKVVADIFFVAFRIPNFFRRITAEGAFAAAFVPVFTDFRAHRDPGDTHRFLQLMLGRFGAVLLLFTLFGMIAAPWLVKALAWGFQQDPDKFSLTVDTTRITFSYLFFISMVALSAGMLNTCGRFAVPAATPVLLNVSVIFAAFALVPQFTHSPVALAVGVVIAGCAQLLLQIPFLRKENLLVRPRISAKKEDAVAVKGCRQVFKLMLPAILGGSASQLNVLVNTLLASFMVTGSVSWLYYSDRFFEFPVGIFGIALGTVILPDLSRKFAANKTKAFTNTLDWAARWVFLICVPSTVALVILALPMIATGFYHGDFTRHGVYMSAASLVAYSMGLIPIVMVKVLAPGFYARKNTKTPVRIGIIAVLVNIVMCLILFYPMQHVGLATATSIAAFVNAALLFMGLRKEQVFILQPGWMVFLCRVCFAATIMGGLLWWGAGSAEGWLDTPVLNRILRLGILVGMGILVYFSVLYITGLRVKAMWLSRGAE